MSTGFFIYVEKDRLFYSLTLPAHYPRQRRVIYKVMFVQCPAL